MINKIARISGFLFATSIGTPMLADLEPSFLNAVRVTQVSDITPKSEVVSSASNGGFELERGEYVSFRDWYTPTNKPIAIKGLAQISDHLLLHWGAATGERGEKYEIAPSLNLGFTYQFLLGKKSQLLLSADRQIGGALSEDSCVGEYTLGGTQEVNCRLAASALPPEDTLDYLFSDSSPQVSLTVKFIFTF